LFDAGTRRAIATVDTPEAPVLTLRSFEVENGVPGVRAV